MLIRIKNLKIKTILGIHDWEKTIDRQIIINAEIETDFEESLKSDNIADTIDYDNLTTKIKKLIAEKKFKLVEKMAAEVINIIMEDKRIKKCKLEIDKVGAVDGVESFSIAIEQKR
jgi:dihydroneopterin aldolase